MTIQDQTSGSQSNSFRQEDDVDMLDANAQSAAGGEGHMPKIRKPYTITKQRERWTEEEHEKFLEALKLYGRAWRKIEEHVGTKTAVQIRSHAQKFFSKVVREPNTSSVKPIEIPPPRAKRKPTHPYPRKLVLPPRLEVSAQEKLASSTSPNSSDVEQANQSPTSVLSVVASHAVGFADSNTPSGSTSPVSSATAVNHAVSSRNEEDRLQEENTSQPDDLASVKLELFPKTEDFVKEDSVEATSTRSLKLFGKIVEVSDSSSQFNTPVSEVGEDVNQLLSPAVDTSGHCEIPWIQPSYGMIPPVYFMNCSSNALEACPAGAVPWWSFYGGVPVPLVPVNNNPDIKKEFLGDDQDKEVHKEGSLTSADTLLVNALEGGERRTDAETRSPPQCSPRMYEEVKGFRPFLRSKGSNKRTSPEQPLRGFVPYKRCLSDRDTQSVEEREGQRTRLCL